MHAIGAAQSGALKNVIATTQAQRAAGSAGSDAPELTQEARDAVVVGHVRAVAAGVERVRLRRVGDDVEEERHARPEDPARRPRAQPGVFTYAIIPSFRSSMVCWALSQW